MQLRENLSLFEWEPDEQGERQWVLHDPLKNKFYYIDHISHSFLQKIVKLSPESLLKLVEFSKENKNLKKNSIEHFVRFLSESGLIKEERASNDFEDEVKGRSGRSALVKWAETYISFTLPLFSPDRFLDRTFPLVRRLFTRAFVSISVVIGLIGILLSARDFQMVVDQARRTFSFESIHVFAFAVFLTKIVHEFSHAYTAKMFGAKVPVMGIKFIVLFPLPYTDTSDSWRVYAHRRRRLIAVSGVASELVLACWATFLWNLSPGAVSGDFLFIIAVSTWVSSVAINAVPFMRFDGYFVLMDLLKIPNLHQRAGAMGKWYLRELLLGLNDPMPEHASRRRAIFYVVFAYVTWVYRFFVFLTIAFLVYHFFIKIIGIFLLIVEVYFFIAKPIIREIMFWWRSRTRVRNKMRSTLIAFSTIILVSLGFVPFQRYETIPGMLSNVNRVPLYSEGSGEVAEINVVDGGDVQLGVAILRIESAEVQQKYDQAVLRLQAAALSFGNSRLNYFSNLAERSSFLEDEKNTLLEARRQLEALTVRSPLANARLEYSTGYEVGDLVEYGELIGWLYVDSGWQINLDVPVTTGRFLVRGEHISFFIPQSSSNRHSGMIDYVADTPTNYASNWELRDLISPSVALESSPRSLEYIDAHLPVYIDVPEHPNLYQTSVMVSIPLQPESFIMGVYRRLYNIIVREAQL